MELTALHIAGMITATFVVFVLGIYAGKKVNTAVDFSSGGQSAGPFLVMGTILGTLIGGSATIGTAQMAYLFGLSAWWFTLAGGIGCLIIALYLVSPMRNTNFETIPRFIRSGYGTTAGIVAAFFISLGMLINIVPQIFSAMALLSAMFSVDLQLAALVTVTLVVFYVVFGGVWGTGLIGISKIMLTSLSMFTAGSLALTLSGGVSGLRAFFPVHPWFNLFGQGLNNDLAAALAVVVGLISSQVYFQGIFASRDLSAARNGVLLGAILAPAIGLGGVLVGLFMRQHYAGINPAQALPLFVINYLPAWFSGVVLATLLLVTIGTGAGLTLSISTILNRDFYMKVYPHADDRQILFVFRLMIVAIMMLVLLIVLFARGEAMILSWTYVALGLRGAAVCFPLLAAIFYKGKISPRAGTLAVICGPAMVIFGNFLPINLNPLYLGLATSFLILLIDYCKNRVTKLADWE
ncbi:MAG TPA: sodium:solute symporter family protein [Candidatus Limnocylindrales bacterium]|nr:sodium:solute symporter family protein [Candidatus Limnocylindrales bacterium]